MAGPLPDGRGSVGRGAVRRGAVGRHMPVTAFPSRAREQAVKRAKVAIISRIRQNLRRNVVCMLRMAFACAANPNCELFTMVFQLV